MVSGGNRKYIYYENFFLRLIITKIFLVRPKHVCLAPKHRRIQYKPRSSPNSPRESGRIRSPDTIVRVSGHIIQLRTRKNRGALHAMRTVPSLHPHRHLLHGPPLGLLVCFPRGRWVEVLAHFQEIRLGAPRCYYVLYHCFIGFLRLFIILAAIQRKNICGILLTGLFVSRLLAEGVRKFRGFSVRVRLGGTGLCTFV